MIEKLMGLNIRDLENYHSKVINGAIRLDANENNYVIPQINDKIAKALLEIPLNQYPDSDGEEVKKILSKKLRVALEELILGCGSDQLIMMILKAFINNGDKILTLSPTFSMYKISNQVLGGKTVEFSLEEGFAFNCMRFLQTIKREDPKVVFITNPNNPTGGIIPREQIIKIIEMSNAVVVVDEAYFEFSKESVADLISYYPNLIVLRTLSKAYGLAGARVGYGIASRRMINILNKVKPPYNISSLDQVAAKVCLENSPMMEEFVEEIIKERSKLTEELREIEGLKVHESRGNFLLVGTKESRGIHQYLLQQKISVRYFGDQGPLAEYLRISIGTKEENRAFCYNLKAYFQRDRKGELLARAR